MTSSKGYSLTPPFQPKPPVITIANLFYCLFNTTSSEMMTLAKPVYLPIVPALEGKPYEVRLLVDFVPLVFALLEHSPARQVFIHKDRVKK